jgi:excisionase family DNA binding protein
MKPQILIISRIACGQKVEYVGQPSFLAHPERWLTVQECADHLQVHRETVLRWVRMRKIPHIVLPGAGKDYRFQRDVINEWGRNRSLGKQNNLKR